MNMNIVCEIWLRDFIGHKNDLDRRLSERYSREKRAEPCQMVLEVSTNTARIDNTFNVQIHELFFRADA